MPAEYKPILNDDGERTGTTITPEVNDPNASLMIDEGNGPVAHGPIAFKVVKPTKDGVEWDQTNDAADHIRYAVTLGLPVLKRRPTPRFGRAIIVGGAPSIKDHLNTIRRLAAEPDSAVFALNWSHTWLIENGIIPKGCVFFEIDTEPESVLKAAHPDVTYFICSHCHPKTFDDLKDFKRVLWHAPANSKPEEAVHAELLGDVDAVGGGVSTFTRSIAVAMFLGYRHFDVFGCDSSFPEDKGSHVEGYQTAMDPTKDVIKVYAQSQKTGEVRRYLTYGYLALQQEEFKTFCNYNHAFFSMKVYGDSLLQFTHQDMYPEQYDPSTYQG